VDLPDWDLTLGEPFSGGQAAWVAPATLPDGTRAVLKLGFPHWEAEFEADALRFWDGRGAVRLLRHDRERWALLLERCEPGDQLWSVADEREANDIAADVLRRLWRPPPAGVPFHLLAELGPRWAGALREHWERHGRPCAATVVDEACELAEQLAATQGDVVLCHQDLHGGNIVRDAAGWLAIDPKPVIGERAFDVASLLRDRRGALLGSEHPDRTVRARLDQLTEALELDRDRARGWGIVHALVWGLDETLHADVVACAELLAAC
jgi:streptomycin 6-kinase